jgi:hypothetical protein
MPVGFLTALVIDYGYDKLMELADLGAAKAKLSAYLRSKDPSLNQEQADILPAASIKISWKKSRNSIRYKKFPKAITSFYSCLSCSCSFVSSSGEFSLRIIVLSSSTLPSSLLQESSL